MREVRCSVDTPLSESDLETFNSFYSNFLGKRIEDKLSLLKAMTLVRRGDLRTFVNFTVLFQMRYEALIPTKQRDLLLSFPSVCKEIYNLVFTCTKNYGAKGETSVLLTREQVSEHLDRTEMFRLDLDTLLGQSPSIIPQHREVLDAYLTNPRSEALRFVLVIMADHTFLGILPGEACSTAAVGQIRSFLEDRFGETLEENLVEFFIVGGGYMRYEQGRLLLGGRNAVFDPMFNDTAGALSALYAGKFLELKFKLVHLILSAELPGLQIETRINQTGYLNR